jgi:hypothetical protein
MTVLSALDVPIFAVGVVLILSAPTAVLWAALGWFIADLILLAMREQA